MKTIKILSTIIFVITLNFSFAQKVNKKTRHFFENPTMVEASAYSLSFKNVVSKFEYLKFGITINNNTSDYLIWDKSKNFITIEDGVKKPVKVRTVKIKPNKGISRTFEVRGGEKFLVNDFKFHFDGLARVPLNGKVQKVEDFKLPQEKNSITAGDFTILLIKSKRKTDESAIYFEAIYNGDDVAIVTLNEISARVNESDVFANDNRKPTPYLLNKGDKLKIKCLFHIPARVADMQFADMYIQFNNAFKVSKAIPVKGSDIDFTLDEILTKEKN